MHLRAHHPGEHRDRRDAGRDRGVDGLEAERADDDDRQQEARDRQEHVDEAGQHDVGPAAEEAGEQADQPADDDADHDGDERAGDRRRGAVHDAGEQVAAQVVGAEPVGGARRARSLSAGTPLTGSWLGEQPGRERPGSTTSSTTNEKAQ